MIHRLFARQPAHEAATFAEARGLLDDGMDLDFVLDLFAEDEAWLAPLLETSSGVGETLAREQPSFYFEASLKQKFLAAAARKQAERAPTPPISVPSSSPLGALRTALAGAAVAGAAGAAGIVTLGMVTADTAVPGDWNYTFKLANERIDYALSRGGQRIDVQLGKTEARVREIQVLSNDGNVSQGDIERLQREAAELEKLARNTSLDEFQKARVQGIANESVRVLDDVRSKQPGLQPAVETTITTVSSAVAAGLGGTTSLPEVTPTAAPAPSATATPDPSPSPSPSPSATPESTATPAVSPTATPKP